MALPIPFTPSLPSPIPFTNNPYANQPPIITQLPRAQASYARKYSDQGFQQYLTSLPAPIRQSLIDFDQQRVQRGQYPTSFQQSYDTTQSALTKTQATPEEHQGLLGAALGDIQDLVSGIPHLVDPRTWINEAQALPEAPGKLTDILSTGNFGQLSQVPGVRLIPGVYDISTVANEGLGGLLQHPVMASLDVLPYAKPVVGAAVESGLSKLPTVEAARAAEAVDLPLTNAARAEVGQAPLPPASAARLAARTSPIVQSLAESKAGQVLRTGFGTKARDIVQTAQEQQTRINQWVRSDTIPDDMPADFLPVRDAARSATEWGTTVDPARRIDITQRLERDRGQVLNDPTLSDVERGMANDYIGFQDELARFAVNRKLGLGYADNEVYPSAIANRLNASQKNLTRTELLTNARESIVNPTPDTLPTIDTSTLLSSQLKRPLALKLAQGWGHSLDAAGYDAAPILDAVKMAKNDKTIPLADLRATIDTHLASPTSAPVLSTGQLIDTLRPYTFRGTGADTNSLARSKAANATIQFLRNNDYSSALSEFRKVYAHQNTIPEATDILDSLTRGRDRQTFLDSTRDFTPRKLEAQAAKNARLRADNPPARYEPLIEQRTKAALRENYITNPNVTQLIDDNLITTRPALGTEYNEIRNGIAAGWEAMRAAGEDPVFVHRVGDPTTASVDVPSITDVYRNPSQVKARTGDATPYHPDLSVALSHQAMQLTSDLGQKAFIENFIKVNGRDSTLGKMEFLPQAQRIAERTGQPVDQILQRLFQRKYREYDPKDIFSDKVPRSFTVPQKGEIWIPKTAAATLKKLFHESEPTITSTLFNPITKLFRISVLPLSVRWQLNNIGGNLMLAASEDPRILTRMLEGFKMVRSGEYDLMRGMPPRGLVSQPKDVLRWDHISSFSDHVNAAHSYMGGKFMGRLLDGLGPVKDVFGNFVDRMYRINELWDDATRGATYLHGRDMAAKHLGVDVTAKEAESAGVALVRKILPQWDRMTPLERNIMRSIFPFYSWAKFITGYALRYPMDHPFRVAVGASLVRKEMEEQGDASAFMDALFLGHPDAHGVQSTISLGGLNPFRDVANYFTLAGITGNTNPIIQSALEAVGVDPRAGAQDLYPDVSVDPATGRLRPSNPNFLSSLLTNVIPQSTLITALIGRNNDFKDVLRTNPDAAASMLRSAAGIPTLFKSINVPQEAFKAELARESVQTTVKNEALRTGDYTRAMNFPDLRAYFNQLVALRQTDPSRFAPYTPGVQPPSPTDVGQKVYQGIVPIG